MSPARRTTTGKSRGENGASSTVGAANRRDRQAIAVLVESEEGGQIVRTISDFVVPTVEEALGLIADGAINKVDLLEQAGLSRDEAEAELARMAQSADS